jgi:hypothetical protein
VCASAYIDVSVWWIGLSSAAFVNLAVYKYTLWAFFWFLWKFHCPYMYVSARAQWMLLLRVFTDWHLFYPVQKEGFTHTHTRSHNHVPTCIHTHMRVSVFIKILFVHPLDPSGHPSLLATSVGHDRSVKFVWYARSRCKHTLRPSSVHTPAPPCAHMYTVHVRRI